MMSRAGLLIVLMAFSHTPVCEPLLTFDGRLDVRLRHDMRSNRPSRDQYRFRYYPSLSVPALDNVSLNSFIVTGDRFRQSHNTFGSGTTDEVHMRRLFVRHSGDYGKTEVGVIPTYKGRVSSSGLSKDGWIQGLRHVRLLGDVGQLELVVGQLDDTDPASAMNLPDNADYIELEYSGSLSDSQSFELSAERMTGGDFLRGEYRHQLASGHTVFAELVKRTDRHGTKAVLGVSGELPVHTYAIDYFAHYSYVSDRIGARAALTEDFLGTGHGVSLEMSGDLSKRHRLDWFVRIDVVDSVSRLLSGVKISFNH